MRLAKWQTTNGHYYWNHWRKAEDRDFCLTVLDENRLFITGLLDPQDSSKRDQTWIYTKGKGWEKSTPMPQMRQGMACGVIPKITGVRQEYTQVTSGTTCERVTSKAECEQAGRQLGVNDYDGDYVSEPHDYSRLHDYWPPGCFTYTQVHHFNSGTETRTSLYFNQHDGVGDWQCDSRTRVCICKETETGKQTGEGGPVINVDEARVVVAGGVAGGNYLSTVEIFTLRTETHEYGGETISKTTGKWTTGRR